MVDVQPRIAAPMRRGGGLPGEPAPLDLCLIDVELQLSLRDVQRDWVELCLFDLRRKGDGESPRSGHGVFKTHWPSCRDSH